MTWAGSSAEPLRVICWPWLVRVTLDRWISVTLPAAVPVPHDQLTGALADAHPASASEAALSRTSVSSMPRRLRSGKPVTSMPLAQNRL